MSYPMESLWAKFNKQKFEALIKEVPALYDEYKSPELLKILGLAYDQSGAYTKSDSVRKNNQKKAIIIFKQLLKFDKFEANKGLGLVYLHQNKLDKSLEHFRKAYNIKRNNPTVYIDLGNVYRAIGKTKNALNWYNKALKNEMTKPAAEFNLKLIKNKK